MLVNALLNELRQSDHPLSTTDFQRVFAKAQSAQEDRSRELILSATMKQRFDAMQSVFAPLIVKFVMPRLSDDVALSMDSARAITGQRIESLPMPQRKRYVPYNDELPATPLNQTLLVNSCFALAQSVLCFLAYLPASSPESWARDLASIIPKRYLDAIIGASVPPRGIQTDRLPLPPMSLFSFIPVVFIWTLEAHRRGNIGSPWSWYVQTAPQPF